MTHALYTAKPTSDRKAWMVYDAYKWPPAPIFIGSMEDAGLVADKKNARPTNAKMKQIAGEA